MSRRPTWHRLALGAAALGAILLVSGPGWAEPDWKSEFEEVCAKTDASMSLTGAELEQLVARCDRLAARIDALDEVARKVMLKRLQRCRDLFAYVLEQKRAAGGTDEADRQGSAAAPAEPAPPGPPAAAQPEGAEGSRNASDGTQPPGAPEGGR